MKFELPSDNIKTLLNILEISNISGQEKEYRKKELIKVYNKMDQTKKIDNKYFDLSHEIRSIEFLSKYPNMTIAQNHLSKSGCDFTIYNNYCVECVCSSSGDEEKNGLDKFHGSGMFDYTKKREIMLTRLTSSIYDKKKFYYEHLENGGINKPDPYIVFLGLGNLSQRFHKTKYGFDLNRILFGVDHDVLVFDFITHKVIKSEYTYNDVIYKKIKNKKEKKINCNIFNSQDYNCISAILFTTANLYEHYTPNNTFLFINPFAQNRIYANRFKNLIYWKAYKENDKLRYYPRFKGKNLNNNLAKEYF